MAGSGRTGAPGPRRRTSRRPSRRAVVTAAGVALAASGLAWWVLIAGPPAPEPSRPAAPPASRQEEAGRATPASPSGGEPAAGAPRRLRARVLAVHPHDPEAYTQGLLWHRGTVIESTGLYGASSLRRWDLENGAIYDRVDLPPDLFGEGLARVGERLVQLTWREGRARLYELAGLALVEEISYRGEGWGLCHDGRRLVMSDGSDRLTLREPGTLAPVGEVAVTLEGRPLRQLNELECRPEGVYANVLGRDEIVRIDPESGRVTAVIDASGLLAPAERRRAEVLNGIAYRPETGTFLLTGKLWPKVFEVELVPAADPP